MNPILSRRECLTTLSILPAAVAAGDVLGAQPAAAPAPATPNLASFPAQDPTLVREIVGASHRDIDKVKSLLKDAPRLANAVYDWGFGDWESALGAAAHTGRRAIAELLLEHGARPDIFAFAMLGNLDAVKAMIAAMPGIERVRGPHGITLMKHAEAGDEAAAKVAEYLATLPGANIPYPEAELSPSDYPRFEGTFAYAPGNTDRFHIEPNKAGNRLTIRRDGGTPQNLFYIGDNKFHPPGAPECVIAFNVEDPRSRRVVITTPAPLLTAERV